MQQRSICSACGGTAAALRHRSAKAAALAAAMQRLYSFGQFRRPQGNRAPISISAQLSPQTDSAERDPSPSGRYYSTAHRPRGLYDRRIRMPVDRQTDSGCLTAVRTGCLPVGPVRSECSQVPTAWTQRDGCYDAIGRACTAATLPTTHGSRSCSSSRAASATAPSRPYTCTVFQRCVPATLLRCIASCPDAARSIARA